MNCKISSVINFKCYKVYKDVPTAFSSPLCDPYYPNPRLSSCALPHQFPFFRAKISMMFLLPSTCGMNKQPTSGASKAQGMVPIIETRRGCWLQMKIISPMTNDVTPAAKTPRPENSAIATQYSMKPLRCFLDWSGLSGGISSLSAAQVLLRNSTSGGCSTSSHLAVSAASTAAKTSRNIPASQNALTNLADNVLLFERDADII